eukprot:TRINITY_DN14318_c0_g1_i1.p1 TRINITY_DN14318_c0_g1~~TRINITY_DN14318_c0_g1_i1.p1  ORF type:complete len:375 (+),score=84.60 TRINITY_DN14318_c0_g1_i1:129-1127(+)
MDAIFPSMYDPVSEEIERDFSESYCGGLGRPDLPSDSSDPSSNVPVAIPEPPATPGSTDLFGSLEPLFGVEANAVYPSGQPDLPFEDSDEPSSPFSSSDPASAEEFSFSEDQQEFLANLPETIPSVRPKRKMPDSDQVPVSDAKRRKRDASRDVNLPVFEMRVKKRFNSVPFQPISPIEPSGFLSARVFRARLDENQTVSVVEEVFPCVVADPKAKASKAKSTHDCVARNLTLNASLGTFSGTAVCKCLCKEKAQRGNDLRVIVLCSNGAPFATSAVCRITCNRSKKLRALANDEKRSCSSDSEGPSSSNVPSVVIPSTPLFPQPAEFIGRL